MTPAPDAKRRPAVGRGRRWGMRRKTLAVAAGVAVLALTAAGCASSSNTAPTTGGAPQNGGTAVMAEPPSDTPNYIFPFTSSSFISITNLNDFSYLLYRPLYWFGNGTQPTFNPSRSLADAPVVSGKTVTNKGLKPGTVLWGTPARPLQQALREQAVLTRLAKRRGKESGKE